LTGDLFLRNEYGTNHSLFLSIKVPCRVLVPQNEPQTNMVLIEGAGLRHLHCTTPALPEGHRDGVAGGARERSAVQMCGAKRLGFECAHAHPNHRRFSLGYSVVKVQNYRRQGRNLSAADPCLRHGAVQLDAASAHPLPCTFIIVQLFYFCNP